MIYKTRKKDVTRVYELLSHILDKIPKDLHETEMIKLFAQARFKLDELATKENHYYDYSKVIDFLKEYDKNISVKKCVKDNDIQATD